MLIFRNARSTVRGHHRSMSQVLHIPLILPANCCLCTRCRTESIRRLNCCETVIIQQSNRCDFSDHPTIELLQLQRQLQPNYNDNRTMMAASARALPESLGCVASQRTKSEWPGMLCLNSPDRDRECRFSKAQNHRNQLGIR